MKETRDNLVVPSGKNAQRMLINVDCFLRFCVVRWLAGRCGSVVLSSYNELREGGGGGGRPPFLVFAGGETVTMTEQI